MVPQSVQLSTYSENNIFKTCISTKMDQQIMKIYHSKISVCFSIQNNINNQTFFFVWFTQTGKVLADAKLNNSKYVHFFLIISTLQQVNSRIC